MTNNKKVWRKQKWITSWRAPLSLAILFLWYAVDPPDSIAKGTKTTNQDSVDDSVNPFDDTDSSQTPSQGASGGEGPGEILQKNHFQGGVQESLDLAPEQGQSLGLDENLGNQKGSSGKPKEDFGAQDIESAFSNKPKKANKAKKKPAQSPQIKDDVAEKRLESKKKALAHKKELKRLQTADEVMAAQIKGDQDRENLKSDTHDTQNNLQNPIVSLSNDPHPNSLPTMRHEKSAALSQTAPEAAPAELLSHTDRNGGRDPNPSSGDRGFQTKGIGMTPEDYDRVPQWTSGQDALAIDGRMRADDLLSESQSLSLLKGSPTAREMRSQGGLSRTFGTHQGPINGATDEGEESMDRQPISETSELASDLFGDPFASKQTIAQQDSAEGLPDGLTSGEWQSPAESRSSTEVSSQTSSESGQNDRALSNGPLSVSNRVRHLAPTLQLVSFGGEPSPMRHTSGNKVSPGVNSRDQRVPGVGPSAVGFVRSEPRRFSLGLEAPRNSLHLPSLKVPMVRDPRGLLLVGMTEKTSTKKTRGWPISDGSDPGTKGSGENEGFSTWPRLSAATSQGTNAWFVGLWAAVALGFGGAGLRALQKFGKSRGNPTTNLHLGSNPTAKDRSPKRL